MISLSGSFSADVKLRFHSGDHQFELGQLGPDFALLRTAQEIPVAEGELETIIDGVSSRWPVRITSPITTASRRFTFEAV